MKLVDMSDSKSDAFTGVAVRVRPLVPSYKKARLAYANRAFLFLTPKSIDLKIAPLSLCRLARRQQLNQQ